MIYNLANTADIGKHCMIYRPGKIAIPYVIEVDTNTGMVHRFKLDMKGRVIVQDDKPVTVKEKVPGVWVEFINKDNEQWSINPD